jgi:hypothetical protein
MKHEQKTKEKAKKEKTKKTQKAPRRKIPPLLLKKMISASIYAAALPKNFTSYSFNQ